MIFDSSGQSNLEIPLEVGLSMGVICKFSWRCKGFETCKYQPHRDVKFLLGWSKELVLYGPQKGKKIKFDHVDIIKSKCNLGWENNMRKRVGFPSKIWNYREQFADKIFSTSSLRFLSCWSLGNLPLGLFWWGHYFLSATNYFCSFQPLYFVLVKIVVKAFFLRQCISFIWGWFCQ